MKVNSENIWKQVVTGTFIACLLAGVSSAFSGEEAEKEVLTAGCKTAYFLMKDLTDDLEAEANIKLFPKRTGNRVATRLLLAGDIEFAFTCQPHTNLAKTNELRPEQYRNWQTVRIAKDPVVVVVNYKNKVDNLSKQQLTDMFSGKIKNWKEVGGSDVPVKLAYQDDSIQSGVKVVFQEQTVGRIDGKLQELSPDGVSFPGPKKRGAYISQDLGAMTYMGLSAYRERYGKIIRINNAEPSRENIVNGRYPIAATYYIIFDTKDKKMVEPFFNFIGSEEGQAAINRKFVADIDWEQLKALSLH